MIWRVPNLNRTADLLTIRILLFRVLFSGPLFSETPRVYSRTRKDPTRGSGFMMSVTALKDEMTPKSRGPIPLYYEFLYGI